MVSSHLPRLVAAAALVSVVQGQAKWTADQVNTTLCYWEQPRAALVRDTVYLDGGNIWWIPGLKNGELAAAIGDENPLGLVYKLNFSKPFKITDNITALFEILPKGLAGGAANNFAPNYLDGAMLANDHEWYLYGGLLRATEGFSPPAGDSVLEYQESQYGVDKPGFLPGFSIRDLPKGMTRYLAYGGAANVPSENKAFYFSGMSSKSKGEIFQIGGIDTADVISNTLIELDMETQLQETWKNITLPSRIKGRANPELVWVPVGEQGILVSLGGVVFPDFSSIIAQSEDSTESKKISPTFMSTIDIYDIASGDWFSQPTKDGPGQLTRGCAVVATAQDSSSFNIYYYGGYDGLSPANPFNDDVWVLSLPSFTWTNVAKGNGPGRAGHKCFMPYPDRMMAIGGYTTKVGLAPTCLRETIRVFDVNTAQWLTEYNPRDYKNYTVPDAVVKKIGGTGTGDAKLKAPSGGWEEEDLGDIFNTKYPTDKIKVYWPYAVAPSTNNTNPTVPTNNDEGGGSGVPAFLPPVLGVVLGLMFLTMIAVLVLLWRRRKLLRSGGRGGMSDAGTEDTNGNRIMNWMRGQTSEAKAPTVATSDYNPATPDADSSVDYPPAAPQPNMAEVMGRPIYHPVELMDTSQPVELHDTGLSPFDVINRYSHLGESPANGSLNNPSAYSHTSQMDHASTLSHSSSGIGGQPLHGISPFDYRPDSDPLPPPIGGITGTASVQTASPVPALATVSETEVASHTDPVATGTNNTHSRNNSGSRVLSGISNLSERDRTHLRQISDTSVSSMNTHQGGGDRILYSPEPGQQSAGIVSSPGPVSPPTAGEREGADYISSRPAQPSVVVSPLGDLGPPPPISGGSAGDGRSSPLRRSVFMESREDMNDGPGGGGAGR